MTAVDYRLPGEALGEETEPGTREDGAAIPAPPSRRHIPSRARLDDAPLPLHALLEDYRFLAERHVPFDVIAARLRMPVDSLQTTLRRHGDPMERGAS